MFHINKIRSSIILLYVPISPNTILSVYKLNSIVRASYISGEEMNITLGSRIIVLFLTGFFCSLAILLQQIQRNILVPGSLTQLHRSAWWITPSTATAAVFIGLAYPCVDQWLGDKHEFGREWSSVLRCLAIFVGITHASVKISFADGLQLSIAVMALSFAMWWLFDRSLGGIILGFFIAFSGTCIIHSLASNGVLTLTEPDFQYIYSWLPGIIFAGGTTFGSIGRQLAVSV